MADKKKSNFQTVEEYQTEKLNKRTADAIKESKKITKEKKDSYTERNELKPGFYDQPSKPPITPETYYGTASGKTSFESPIVDPDTSMMMNKKKGGMTKPKKMSGGGDTQGPFLQGVTPEIERSAEGAEGSQARIERDKAKITAHTKAGNIGIGRTESKIYQGPGTPELKQREDKISYDKNFNVNDSTDVLLYGEKGRSKSEYSGYGETKKSQGTFRVGAKATMKFEKGGAVEIGKGKDYIKDLL